MLPGMNVQGVTHHALREGLRIGRRSLCRRVIRSNAILPVPVTRWESFDSFARSP